jgi:hypothetical protein
MPVRRMQTKMSRTAPLSVKRRHSVPLSVQVSTAGLLLFTNATIVTFLPNCQYRKPQHHIYIYSLFTGYPSFDFNITEGAQMLTLMTYWMEKPAWVTVDVFWAQWFVGTDPIDTVAQAETWWRWEIRASRSAPGVQRKRHESKRGPR